MSGYIEPHDPEDETEDIEMVGVYGMLTEDSPWFGTTYSRIREKVQAALDNPNCKGILLCIDSPGGSTDHAFETAEFLADAAKKKPMWAVADVNAYSAAYLLASATNRIYAAPTSGGVGSIGVYAAHVEFSGMLDKEGIGVTLISAGKGKTDGNPYKPLSKEAKAKIQAEVDRLYESFVAFVSRGRGLSADAITTLGAALTHGADAVSSGLADAVGTIEEVMEKFHAKVSAPTTSAQAPAGANPHAGVSMSDVKQAGAAAAAEEEVKQKQEESVQAKAEVAKPAAPSFAEAQEIGQLCKLAGLPDKTAEMLEMRGKGKTMEEIRTTLIDSKAESSREIRSNPLPKTGTTEIYEPANGPLMKAMKALGGEGKVA
jgi:signal peptide peptidase SppA